MKFHRNGSEPKALEIFVFGSNLAGRHGAGAAYAARKRYGAEYRNPRGLQGRSYAIPTKDENLDVLTLKQIKTNVDEFVTFVKNHADRRFFITAIGTGLAGFSHEEIAPMFRELINEKNVSFPDAWEHLIVDKPKFIIV